MSDDVTIVVRVGDQTAAGFRDINGRLRDMNGRFAGSAGDMRRSSSIITKALVEVKGSLLSLAPAAVPVAASFAPIAVQAGAAGLAVGAFGAAVAPQIGKLGEAAKAQDKYTDAVTKYGRGSKQAAEAALAQQQTLASMPAATQRASVAYLNLRTQFDNFSDSTAKFTMVPVEHSFAVLGAILPKLTPMVEGTSTQLDRLMKVAGGGINTGAFDTLSAKVSDFSNQALKNATDRAIHFIRVMSEGDASGPLTQFMDYAREQGPAVKELFSNLVSATANLAEGASQAGPGLLSIVNALAKMAAAVPPELIGNLMQVYAAFKLITLAGAGIAAVGAGVQGLATKFAALQATSAAAGGGVAGLKAAFLSLGTAAKATVIVAGVTLLAVALSKLSDIGKAAPPDVDRLTTSLANLGATGKVTGEAARAFGADLGGLADSLRVLARPSNLDKTQQFLTSLIGMDSTPIKDAKEDLDGVDKALANLVRGGKADLAKVAFDDVAKAMKKQGLTGKELEGQLDDYKSALADAALEAKLTADSQGLFGAAAQATQAKLDAQKASADGLRQSIQALNDANRAGLGGMIGFEAAIDAAAKAAKDNAGALSMSHGVLDLNSEKARNAASALQDLAGKTDAAATSARESGSSWATVNGIYARGRDKLIESAQAMGLTASQAKTLASQILQIPDKTARVKGNIEDLVQKVQAAKASLANVPASKRSRIQADITDLLRKLAMARAAQDGIHSKSVTYTANYRVVRSGGSSTAYSGSGGHQFEATGGLLRRASGGSLQHFDEGGSIQGPGGPMSDSILATFASGAMARVSNTEYVVQAAAVRKYGVNFLNALNNGRLKVAGFASGGLTKTQFKGLYSSPDMAGLTSTISDVRTRIKDKTSGGTESRLLHTLDAVAKRLVTYEKSLISVNKALDGAKTKLNDLKSASAQAASSVTSGILSEASITRGGAGNNITVGSVIQGLTDSRDKAAGFASALAGLKSKGLSPALMQQIGEAGINGGGAETADALMTATPNDLRAINMLQSQITASATAAGKTTADSLYASAIKTQTASVTKLTKSQDKLENSMAALARSLDKSLARAIGKKAAGGIVGAAASGGLRAGLTWVGEHEPELLQLPAGSRVWSGPDSRRKAAAPWESMLNTPRRAGASAGRAQAASAQPIVVHQTIELDGRVVAQQMFEPLKNEIRGRGGNVQSALGQPNR